MQPFVLASAKISLLILLYRIFIIKTFRITVLVLMAVVGVWYVAITLAGALICLPVKSRWHPDIPGHCGNQYILNIIDPIPWILTDFAILFAPIPMVWRLQMPTRRKAAIAGLFLVGGLYVRALVHLRNIVDVQQHMYCELHSLQIYILQSH